VATPLREADCLDKPCPHRYVEAVNTVLEIENALRRLPATDRWEVLHRILDELQAEVLDEASVKGSRQGSQPPPELPDYAARRRRIFGDKILPNMVLDARAEERW